MDRIVSTASIKDAENCRSFVVFDTETTGLYPWRDKLVEIGAVRFLNGEPVETFHSIIDPGIHIPENVSQINHITDDMVAGAPTAAEVMAAFDEFVATDDIVGHNIDFDLRFIQSAGSTLPDRNRRYFDTAELARQMVKGPDKVFDQATGKWRNDYNSQYEVKGHWQGNGSVLRSTNYHSHI